MFNADFYPTPLTLIHEMLSKADFDTVQHVLEPSAGRGDIIDAIRSKSSSSYGPFGRCKVDAIEIELELASVLTGKGYKPIASDFLSFQTFKRYDLVVMNPPFSSGAAHLLKAIEVQSKGGQIVCLLNAETIRNPYTNERRELVNVLDQLGASIEYLQRRFSNADRSTDVEVALVHVDIPAVASSDILANLKQAEAEHDGEATASSDLVEGEYIAGAVRRYGIEAKAGLALIREYQALTPILSRSFGDNSRPILELKADGESGNLLNAFVESLRMKYWRELFQSDQFAKIFTQKTRETYRESISELKAYEFNIANIKQIQADLSGRMLATMDDAIVGLFDEFSSQYWDEHSKNIHYYNGWKTNKAWRINSKVITHLNAWGYYGTDNYDPTNWDTVNKLADIHKVFAYLDGKLANDTSTLDQALQAARQSGQSKGVDLEYVTVDFFKKGTAHIRFKREDLLKKFNLIGSQRKGWLPPEYGAKSYSDMDATARSVVDEFEGRDSYEDTLGRRDFYLGRPQLTIGVGQ